MLTLTATACIDAPVDAVWRVLARLESIEDWVEAIQHAECPGQRTGVGALRVCTLKQATIRETIVEWDEGRSYRYRGEGAPLMRSAFNRWSVTAHGQQTLVSSESEVVFQGGWFGRLLEPLMAPVFRKMGARSLAGLKYLVEHGAPHPGPASALPPVPAGC